MGRGAVEGLGGWGGGGRLGVDVGNGEGRYSVSISVGRIVGKDD